MNDQYLLIPSFETCPHPALADAANEAGYCVISTTASRKMGNRKNLKLVATSPFRDQFPKSQWRQSEELVASLSEIISVIPISIAAAATDWHLNLLYRVREEAHPSLKICGPPANTFHTLSSKIASRNFLNGADVPIPRGMIVRGPDYEIGAFEMPNFPLVVKLDPSIGSSGVSIVSDLGQLEISISKARLFGTDLVLEEFLGTTNEYSHQFFVCDGVWLPAYSLRKHSHLGPSFSTSIEILERSHEENKFADFLTLFSRMPNGFYSAQFKEDIIGDLKIIEINCRIGNNFRILRRALPSLGSSFLNFYGNPKNWENSYAALRDQVVSRFAVSPVEEALAAWQRVSFSSKGKRLRKALNEISYLASVARKNPTLDYYFCSLATKPLVSLAYYGGVIKEARSLKERRRRQSPMLPR